MNWRRWMIGVGVLAGVAGLATRVFLRYPGTERPPPRWTQADLPPGVAVTENAWPAFSALPPVDVGADAIDMTAVVGSATWSDFRSHGGSALLNRDFVSTFESETSAANRALERPRFVDTCGPTPVDRCDWLAVFRTMRALLVHALIDADHGREVEAVETIYRVRRAAIDGALHPRSMLGFAVSLGVLRESARAGLLLRASDAMPAEAPATEAWARLAALEHGLDWAAVTGRTAFIAEYLSFWNGMDKASAEAGRPSFGWIIDYGECDALLAACIDAQLAGIPGRCDVPRGEVIPHNKMGRNVVGAVMVMIEHFSQTAKTDRQSALEASKALSLALGAP